MSSTTTTTASTSAGARPKPTVTVSTALPGDADANAMGLIHGVEFATFFTSVFPMGPSLSADYLNFRQSQCRRQARAVHDAQQAQARGAYPSILLKASVPDAERPGEQKIVGMLVGRVLPPASDKEAEARIKQADDALGPFEFPEGYNEELWTVMKSRLQEEEAKLIQGQQVVDIGILAVSSSAHGLGVGRALLSHVRAQYASLPIVLTAVESAVGFYRKLGFEVDPTRVIDEQRLGYRLFPAIAHPPAPQEHQQANGDGRGPET